MLSTRSQRKHHQETTLTKNTAFAPPRSAPIRFLKRDSEHERYWLHHQHREDIQQLGDALKRSTIERGYDIMEAKEMLAAAGQPVGAAACAKAWQDNIRLAKNSEPIKTSYVDAVFTVWSRMMNNPTLAEIILMFEKDLPMSPWDSIYKLEAGGAHRPS